MTDYRRSYWLLQLLGALASASVRISSNFLELFVVGCARRPNALRVWPSYLLLVKLPIWLKELPVSLFSSFVCLSSSISSFPVTGRVPGYVCLLVMNEE